MQIKKKQHPRFRISNLHAKNRSRLADRWRTQRGIDNKKRVKRGGYGAMPSIGYKNAPSVRGLRPDGFAEVLVHNVQELAAISGKAARIAHGVSKRKREAIVRQAQIHGIRVVN